MKIYIMRHGETALNRQQVLQGQLDEPLCDAGRQQAETAGAGLRALGLAFGRVLASPLQRAVETASIAGRCPAAEVETDERLLELDYGPYERMPYKELDGSMFAWFRDPESAPAPAGVESIQHLEERVWDFLQAITRREAAGEAGERVLIVTHGVTIRAILKHLEHMTSAQSWERAIGNCDVYEAEVKDGTIGFPVRIYSLPQNPAKT